MLRKMICGMRGGVPFALALCLAALVFMGCPMEGDDSFINRQFIPAGEWVDGYGSSYEITKDEITYHVDESTYEGVTYPEQNLKGTIVIAVDFGETSGVLIIKVSDDNYTGLSQNDYTCVYYKEYSASHVYLANPIDSTYAPVKETSLNKALKTFTEGNVNTHVTSWGSGYNFKQ